MSCERRQLIAGRGGSALTVADEPAAVTWNKCGHIFSAPNRHEWMASHAQIPTVGRIDSQTMRVYFATRDKTNRSCTTFVDLEAARPRRVLYVHERPILEPGATGGFDDCGVMPSSIVERSRARYLYYIGWNTSTTVPYRNSIGLAVSENGSQFRRAYDGPIMDRSRAEPHFCSTPFVLLDDDKWRMWYLSCVGWEQVDGRPEPRYHIRYAESKNGIDWHRDGTVCIDFAHRAESIGRPWVVRTGGVYRMWFCYRRISGYRTHRDKSYRIGYAESSNGIEWTRLDGEFGLDVSKQGWDSEMVAYPCVYACGGTLHMLYNGNGFGRTGFGSAVLRNNRLIPKNGNDA